MTASTLLKPVSSLRLSRLPLSQRRSVLLPRPAQAPFHHQHPQCAVNPAFAAKRKPDFTCNASAAATFDESAIPEEPTSNFFTTLIARIRSIAFFLWSFTIAVPFFVVMLVAYPFVMMFDKHRRLLEHSINDVWAQMSTWPFYRVEVVGRENLPHPSTPAVYIANHQSFLDIYSLFHLNRAFKFISKTSNFVIPIVGWSMFLTGHVMLNRVDRRSQLKCLQSCRELLGEGASVLFFPEGTRSVDRRLQEFKKGAFSVAVKAGVPVVPISLIGTGDLMQSGREGEMYGGKVTIVVHKPIPCKGRDADEVTAEARELVASSLPKAWLT